jgi:hypothetical protein
VLGYVLDGMHVIIYDSSFLLVDLIGYTFCLLKKFSIL